MQIATPSLLGLTIFAGPPFFFAQSMLDSQLAKGGKHIKPPSRQKRQRAGKRGQTGKKQKNAQNSLNGGWGHAVTPTLPLVYSPEGQHFLNSPRCSGRFNLAGWSGLIGELDGRDGVPTDGFEPNT